MSPDALNDLQPIGKMSAFGALYPHVGGLYKVVRSQVRGQPVNCPWFDEDHPPSEHQVPTLSMSPWLIPIGIMICLIIVFALGFKDRT
jgi:hypothetical protein